jgi:hypothetical protein
MVPRRHSFLTGLRVTGDGTSRSQFASMMAMRRASSRAMYSGDTQAARFRVIGFVLSGLVSTGQYPQTVPAFHPTRGAVATCHVLRGALPDIHRPGRYVGGRTLAQPRSLRRLSAYVAGHRVPLSRRCYVSLCSPASEEHEPCRLGPATLPVRRSVRAVPLVSGDSSFEAACRSPPSHPCQVFRTSRKTSARESFGPCARRRAVRYARGAFGAVGFGGLAESASPRVSA